MSSAVDNSPDLGQSDHEDGHKKREWQPWSTSAKWVFAFGIIAALGLAAVFANLALPVH